MKTTKWLCTVLFCAVAASPGLTQEKREGAQDREGTVEEDYDYRSDPEGITINAENMELSTLIKLLSIKEQVNIITSGKLEGTACVNLYNVSLSQVLDAVLKPNGFDYRLKDGVYLVMKAEEFAALEKPASPMVVRIFRLNYLNLQEAEKFLKPLMSEQGQLIVGELSQKGIPTGATDTGGDSSASPNLILVKDTPEVMLILEEAIKALDIRPQQVLVEATILEAILNDHTKLGVDFNALGGIKFSDLNATTNFFSVDMDDASGDQLDDLISQGMDSGFASDNPEDGFAFGILRGNVGLFIEALESVVDTNVIANPKVLVLNRQKAEIIIGGRLGYYGTETLSNNFSQQSVEFLDTGTQLRFRPFISDDGYVRLEIRPARSNGVVDPVTGLPSENTSEVTSNIMVKDGDTVVIGGLIEEFDQLIEKRVPLLGSIPILGWFFRRTETTTRRTEIIILITPHIIDPERPDNKAEGIVEDFEQRKRLFRDGFPFFSRTIYAARHLTTAKKDLHEGSLGWARYHFNRAAALDAHCRGLISFERRLEAAENREEESKEGMEEYLRSETE